MAGFFGKLLICEAAMAEGFYVLAVIGVLSSVVAAYYYLRIIKVMFFDEPADPFDRQMVFVTRTVILLIHTVRSAMVPASIILGWNTERQTIPKLSVAGLKVALWTSGRLIRLLRSI